MIKLKAPGQLRKSADQYSRRRRKRLCADAGRPNRKEKSATSSHGRFELKTPVTTFKIASPSKNPPNSGIAVPFRRSPNESKTAPAFDPLKTAHFSGRHKRAGVCFYKCNVRGGDCSIYGYVFTEGTGSRNRTRSQFRLVYIRSVYHLVACSVTCKHVNGNW